VFDKEMPVELSSEESVKVVVIAMQYPHYHNQSYHLIPTNMTKLLYYTFVSSSWGWGI
jgi:hypothetical protein